MPIEIEDVYVDVGGDETVEYIRHNHYTGTCNPISNKWCLRRQQDDAIVGGIVFANPMSEQVRKFVAGEEEKASVTELHRLYTDDRCGKNVESWFISKALKLLKKKKPKYRFVISYADETEGHDGTIYKATNFLYTGKAQERKFYIDEKGRLRSPRQGGENITLSDAKEKEWDIVKRKTKHRYVYPLPDNYESRSDVIEEMKCEVSDYPNS